MTAIANRFADRFTIRTVNLLRFDAALRRKAVKQLKALERELVARLAVSNPTGATRTAFQQARLDALLKQTRGTLRTAYRNLRISTDSELSAMVDAEADYTRKAVNQLVGADIMTVSVNESMLRQIVSDTLIEGSPSREWWKRQEVDTFKRFGDEMRKGMLAGETNEQLVRRVVGTKAAGYTDGFMAVSRRQAQALVRSSVMGVANGARMETYRANDDVVRGVQAVATLDLRTTEVCIARNGSSWDLDGDPLPESPRQEPFPGFPPWHWGCRTTLISVLKPIDELLGAVGTRKAAQLRALPKQTRSSLDGQVAASTTYEAWLKGRSVAEQVEVLGRGKYELWKAGQLSLTDLIDQSGRPLSIEQLRSAA